MPALTLIPSDAVKVELTFKSSVIVVTPAVTTKPPAVILTPVLAVIIPTESIFVTSSYVNVPAIPTVPLNLASVTKVISPVARST